jgi:hypothetical protein
LLDRWRLITDEIKVVHTEVVGTKVLAAAALLAGDERIESLNLRLRARPFESVGVLGMVWIFDCLKKPRKTQHPAAVFGWARQFSVNAFGNRHVLADSQVNHFFS